MKKLVILSVMVALFLGIGSQAFAHGAYRGEWWIHPNITVAVIGPGYGYAGWCCVNHVNVHVIWHYNQYQKNPKVECHNLHIGVKRMNGQRCITFWNSRTGAQNAWCLPQGSDWWHMYTQLASNVQYGLAVYCGVGVSIYICYVIAGLLVVPALAV